MNAKIESLLYFALVETRNRSLFITYNIAEDSVKSVICSIRQQNDKYIPSFKADDI